jgi:ABC-type uncharacterized transport system ATPase subunit
MKNKYNFEQKKTNIIGVPPLDWTWYEKFDYLFAKATKIDGVPKGVDQKVQIIQKKD